MTVSIVRRVIYFRTKNLMKTSMRWLNAARIPVLALLILFCCSDPGEEEITPPNEEEEEITPDDADNLLKTFSFLSSTQITGSVPAVANSTIIRNDSKDTIYVLPGVKNVFRLSHPSSVVINGIFMAVEGSTFYVDVPALEEEDSDTVAVFLFEIDPEDLEGSMDVPVKITAYDAAKQPIDIIERIITVEEPSQNACDILVDGDTMSFGTTINEWLWRWTVVLDASGQPKFVNGPGRMYGTLQKDIEGCCNPGCPAYVVNPTTQTGEWIFDSFVDAGTYYSISHESFMFYKNGTFYRYTIESEKNFDPASTDWCAGIPAYREGFDHVAYFGTHDYVPGDKDISYITDRFACSDPLGICGYGSRSGRVTFSCHALMITAGTEGQQEIRFYKRHFGNPIGPGSESATSWNF